jgi:hypothetical protein
LSHFDWRLSCPEDIAQHVREIGGVNPYDEPNFRLVWSQSSETLTRCGGIWDNPDLPGVQHYLGYRDVLLEQFTPCWLLQQWYAPDAKDIAGNELFGTPRAYYIAGYDIGTGLQTLGEYPHGGRYLTVFPLVTPTGEAVPLSQYIVNMLVHVIVTAKEITVEQKKAVIAEEKERQRAMEVSQIEDSLKNAHPEFGEIRSAAGLNCVSAVQKKMEAIEKYWQSGVSTLRQRGKGLSIA